MSLRKIAAASVLALALSAGSAPLVLAQTPAAPPADALTDPSFKGPEVVKFMGLKPGDKVADIVAGRFVRVLSQSVGPTGHVYAYEPTEILKHHPELVGMMNALAAQPAYGNISVVSSAINAAELPAGLDAVFIRQNYHDLHDDFMGPADVPMFNKHVFDALKKGGVYVVLDHADAAGSGLTGTNTRHRIDVAAVKAEVEAAGFVLDSESTILANPADDHTKMVFDPSIRGKTDQFRLKFKKP